MDDEGAGLEEHPILVRDVVRRDGSRTIALRVFCKRQLRSMPLRSCEGCAACMEVAPASRGNGGIVRCAPLPRGAPQREQTVAVGAAVAEHVLCVESELPLTGVLDLFVTQELTSVFVVDVEGRVEGLVREVDLVRARRVGEPGFPWRRESSTARQVMSSALTVREDTPVKQVVLRMAGSHLRDAAVVSESGELIGVLHDLDAMRWLAKRRPPR